MTYLNGTEILVVDLKNGVSQSLTGYNLIAMPITKKA